MSAHLYFALFLWTVIAAGVGVHASRRGRSGVLWGVLTFFTGLIGVVVYLVVLVGELDDRDRDKERPGEGRDGSVVVCPNCDARHAGSPKHCSECGERIEEENERRTASIVRSGPRAYCGNCNARVEFGVDECPDCHSVF